ncbi:hypothetical protein KHS38_01895 [Mucilaginibacter sp. Bleaf8]|uniref:hypothetical protein n=1 Tax=Mucilaginibacter sp. Bleaf8 TaxID=2834430 RepID=UPI001BCA8BD1|nr:hypothetical protein [Mucilaginibacter sp. Bleaf8]MBS7563145.1 hypothetical protein [Mucilaginibacter sp. Bleaf8]
MDIYYSIEEKYLHAVEEYWYGETPKSLQLLNEIIAADPSYAKAYYHLGMIYYYEMKDYQAAGYNFKTCIELDSRFPDVYEHYLHLLSFLKMEKVLPQITEQALSTPGVDGAVIWNTLGLHAEKNRNLLQARHCYQEAFAIAVEKTQISEIDENLERVKLKMQRSSKVLYSMQE